MIDEYRIIGRRSIEIRDGESAAVGCLGVVVLEPDHPLARRSFGGALADGCLDGGNGSQVAVHFLQVP